MTNFCKICNGDFFEVLYSNVIDPITGEDFSIKVCQSCGVGHTFPFHSNLSNYYPDSYRNFLPFVKYLLCYLYQKISASWFKDKSHKPRYLLEVGCGPGFFLRYFLNIGFNCYAVERPSKQLDLLKIEFPNTKIYESIDDIIFSEFDVVLMYHVLEHLEDPVSTLKKLHKHMSLGANLIVAIPNFGCFQNKLFRKNWFHLDPPRHRFHIGEISFQNLIYNSGFKITRVHRLHLILDTFCFIESFVNCFTPNKNFISKNLFSKTSFYGVLAFFAITILFIPAFLFSLVGYLFKSSTVNTYILKKV